MAAVRIFVKSFIEFWIAECQQIAEQDQVSIHFPFSIPGWMEGSLDLLAGILMLKVLAELAMQFKAALHQIVRVKLMTGGIRGRGALTSLLIIPIILPPVAVSIAWLFMYDYEFGIINYLLNEAGFSSVRWLSDPSIALYAMMVVDVWQATPFAFLLLYAALLSLPRDPYEAAAIDGAGRWHVFRTVTLPLLQPVLLVVTDGEPTAHVMADGQVYFNYPPVRETVEATLREVMRCTRDGIRINTFMLDADHGLQHFVEQMTSMNRGRAFFTNHENLGDYVLVDFIEQKRTQARGSGRRAG